MRVDESGDRNIGMIRLVREILGDRPPVAAPETVGDPYYGQGSHPDVVERVWEQLGASLPKECRCLVYGTPALVDPASGVVLAFSMGTAYYLRLTAGSLDEATRRGAKTDTSWTSADGETRDLGADWIAGGWEAEELAWCASTFAELRGVSP